MKIPPNNFNFISFDLLERAFAPARGATTPSHTKWNLNFLSKGESLAFHCNSPRTERKGPNKMINSSDFDGPPDTEKSYQLAGHSRTISHPFLGTYWIMDLLSTRRKRTLKIGFHTHRKILIVVWSLLRPVPLTHLQVVPKFYGVTNNIYTRNKSKTKSWPALNH